MGTMLNNQYSPYSLEGLEVEFKGWSLLIASEMTGHCRGFGAEAYRHLVGYLWKEIDCIYWMMPFPIHHGQLVEKARGSNRTFKW